MTSLLKESLAFLKDYVGLDLPDWIKGLLISLLFLGVVIVGSGFAYFVCATHELPRQLQVELALPLFRMGDFIRCGLASLQSFAQMVAMRDATSGIVMGTLFWFLVMAALGLLSQANAVLLPVFRGRFHAPVLKLSEEKQEKLRAEWEESMKSEEVREQVDSWAWTLAFYNLIGSIARIVLTMPLLIFAVYLLVVNMLLAWDFNYQIENVLLWLDESEFGKFKASLLNLGFALKDGDLTYFGVGSIVCVLLSWIVFRYSETFGLLRSLLLVVAMLNLFLLAGRLGALDGGGNIEFREVSIESDRASLGGSKNLLLLYSMGTHVRIYSCESQKVIVADLAAGDVVSYGNSVKLRDLCASRHAS